MRFETVIGIQPGYGVNSDKDPVEHISRAWKELCEKEYERSGINISAIILPSRAVYIGPCAEGGEKCAYMFGVFSVKDTNPDQDRAYNIDDWMKAVSMNCNELRKKFEQEFLMVSFSPIERTHFYDKPQENKNEQTN